MTATTPTEPTIEQASAIVAQTLETVLDAFPEELAARALTPEEYATKLAKDAFPHICNHAGFDDGEFDKLHPLTQANYIAAAHAVLAGDQDRKPATDFERIVKDMLVSGWSRH